MKIEPETRLWPVIVLAMLCAGVLAVWGQINETPAPAGASYLAGDGITISNLTIKVNAPSLYSNISSGGVTLPWASITNAPSFATIQQVADAVIGAMTVFAPTNLVTPELSGTFTNGASVTSGTGTWFSIMPSGPSGFQWLTNGVAVAGATDLTWTVSAETGVLVSFSASYTNHFGTGVGVSTNATVTGPAVVYYGLASGQNPTVVSGGSGYTQDDILTMDGGELGVPGTELKFKVDVTDGVVTAIPSCENNGTAWPFGCYITVPSDPIACTGGTGIGCTVNMSGKWQTPPMQ
ncbi:MAG: hypothetical protein HZC54_00710 [Verrucomicrobia bacterium]|nr:hypothetical protein [Verrucomicrobiota bacterium]